MEAALTLVGVDKDDGDVDVDDDGDVGRCLFSEKELNFYFFKMSPRSTRTIWRRNSLLLLQERTKSQKSIKLQKPTPTTNERTS